MANGRLRTITDILLALWLVTISFITGLPAGVAQSEVDATALLETNTTVDCTVDYQFGQQVTFTVHASSDTVIEQMHLFFRPANEAEARSAAMDIEPGREVESRYVHDLSYSPLPPFASVFYWFHIEYAGSETEPTTTQPKPFVYKDNRFQWRHLPGDGVTVHWIAEHGDPVFGQAALDIAVASLKEISAELDTSPPESIDIYIYNSQDALYGAMALGGRGWVVGQAHPDLGAIVVAIPFDSSEGYKWRMRRYIPHEVTHLLVYEAATPAGYKYVPEWLDEGLATANEQLPTVEHGIQLEAAREEEQLIPLQELCVPFPPNPQTAFLAYAQSGSVVSFIRDKYGDSGIRHLLAAYRNGDSCAAGVQNGLDISLTELETAWLASLEPKEPWQALVDRVGAWVGLWLLGVLVALPMFGRIRRTENEEL
jgi:hypothetical protein